MACHTLACSISPRRPHPNIRTSLKTWTPSRYWLSKVFLSLKPMVESNYMTVSSPHSYVRFLSHDTVSFDTDEGFPLIMTCQMLPAENDSLISHSSTSYEAEDPASRLVSVVTRSRAVSADAFAYPITTSSLPIYYVTDCCDVHSTDWNAAVTPQPPEPTDSDPTPSQECISKQQALAQNNRDIILRP